MSDQMAPAPKTDVPPAPPDSTPPNMPARPRRRATRATMDAAEAPAEEWMMSYSDMVTLLLTMFIALLMNADFTNTIGGGGGESGIDGTERAGEGHDTGAGGSGAGRDGMRGTLQEWFQLNVTSPYTDENGYVLAMRGPANRKSIPADANLAVVKDQDLAQIAFRERTLTVIREKLVEARIEQYVTADIEGDGIRLNVPNSILFATGAADFASEGAGVIRAIVPIVAADTFTISVEGHTDNAPIQTERFPSNWELSAQRAASVVRLMAEAGIKSSRLEAVGLADTQPLATNESVDGRAQNRRVTLFLRL